MKTWCCWWKSDENTNKVWTSRCKVVANMDQSSSLQLNQVCLYRCVLLISTLVAFQWSLDICEKRSSKVSASNCECCLYGVTEGAMPPPQNCGGPVGLFLFQAWLQNKMLKFVQNLFLFHILPRLKIRCAADG